ncbi:hypothetical protein U0070_007540 [Myodes glareolus]|uniref:Very-long-chain (3R)-3-hydroxyacyl-CoA dehydratase n=1 Tax=Myodes glareolus TaxID=447135 RepID=A0AAW0J1Z7_MYOGA
MGPSVLPTWLQPRYRKDVYLFIYYLVQFCGHSWILTNMTARFFSFGKDSMVDTFYAIGLVMRVCQSISLLELLHIYIGIESNHLFPRFLQVHMQHAVSHRNILRYLDMAQSNAVDANLPTVCSCRRLIYANISQSYSRFVLTFTIYQSLPYFESFGTNSTVLPFDISSYLPYVLKLYLMMLFIGMYFTYSHLYTERRDVLRIFPVKQKKM